MEHHFLRAEAKSAKNDYGQGEHRARCARLFTYLISVSHFQLNNNLKINKNNLIYRLLDSPINGIIIWWGIIPT